jgi:D-glycero-alpha-D-manno-heptose-7-phosphate kinase
MIVTRTPLRISLAGGGTDFPDYYQCSFLGGCVVSTAIDKYIYVITKERYDSHIRVGYSKTENVSDLSELEHELVRECLRIVGVRHGIEVSTMADIPSQGSGLGSSSAVTVGLLNALYAHRGITQSAAVLADQACQVEIEVLGKPIGKQDQYIAAYGGLRRIDFDPGGDITVEDVPLSEANRFKLSSRLMLFYTGITRKSESVLAEQKQHIPQCSSTLQDIRKQADIAYSSLKHGNLDTIGEVLYVNWLAKKKLARGISTPDIDRYYGAAIGAGADGGKIAGAGGGGFLLLYCKLSKQAAVRRALSDLVELHFNLEPYGSQVIFNAK